MVTPKVSKCCDAAMNEEGKCIVCGADGREGNDILIDDLEFLLKEARDGEFGDFTNKKYAAPKMALAQRFNDLRQNVINGKYD